MQLRFLSATVFAAAIIAAQAAQAQDVEAGRRLAQTWCSGCHRIDGENAKIQNDAVPSFTSIAQMPSTTTMSLSAFLRTPHSRMPDYALTQIEIENVSAYILSLRKPPH